MNILKTTLIATTIGLSGCASVVFDNNEYEWYVKLETLLQQEHDNCNNEMHSDYSWQQVVSTSNILKTYTKYGVSDESKQIAVILNNDAHEYMKRIESGDTNETFCKIKTKLMLKKTEEALTMFSAKIR